MYWDIFEKEIQKLNSIGIEVVINLAPYHADFVSRVKKTDPTAIKKQSIWMKRVLALASPQVKVLNHIDGIPGDDGGPKYWEDGAHTTCFGIMEMLKVGLAQSK